MPANPIERTTLWAGLFHLKSQSEIDEGAARNRVFSNLESNQSSPVEGPERYSLSHRFTLL